jgi:hypothetical protein
MMNIPLTDIFAKMPVEELDQALNDFLAPITELLPEERLRRVVPLAVRGILARETPVIAAMAQNVSQQEMDCWAAAKRIYRFVWNERFNHHQLYKGLWDVLPIGVLGAFGYIAILAAWWVGREKWGWLSSYAPIALFGMAFFGTIFSTYLTYLEPFVIKAMCLWCISSAVIITLLLLLSLNPLLRALTPETDDAA